VPFPHAPRGPNTLYASCIQLFAMHDPHEDIAGWYRGRAMRGARLATAAAVLWGAIAAARLVVAPEVV
jgi:hypothetical protein